MSATQGRPNWAEKQLFTTGEAAEVCRVSQQTIIRCFDSGRLEGYRVPGSRFRKIPRNALLRFMRANEIATDLLEGPNIRVLVVNDDDRTLGKIRDALVGDDRFEISSARTGYDAGVLTERVKPHLILIDAKLPDVNGRLVCERIRVNPDLKDTKVLLMRDGAKSKRRDEESAPADGVVQKPFTARNLVTQIRTVMNLEGVG